MVTAMLEDAFGSYVVVYVTLGNQRFHWRVLAGDLGATAMTERQRPCGGLFGPSARSA
jgi:hypothetical protein